MEHLREYPFDTDSLEKGSRISVDTIEHAFSVSHGTDAYQIAALRAVAYVERRFRDRGIVVTVVQRKGEIHVLTDAEAAVENARRFDLGIGAATRAHFRNQHVDRSQLPANEIDRHDRRLESDGRYLSGGKTARALPAPRPHQRATPLPPGTEEVDE